MSSTDEDLIFDPYLFFCELKCSLIESEISDIATKMTQSVDADVSGSKEIVQPHALATLREDLLSIYGLFSPHDFAAHTYEVLDKVTKLTEIVTKIDEDLIGDYWPRELTLSNGLVLSWPASASYLKMKLQILNEFHKKILNVLIDRTSFSFAYDHDYPAITLITNSHNDWIKKFSECLNTQNNSLEKVDFILKSKKTLLQIIDQRETQSERVSETAEQIRRGRFSILPKWYSVSQTGLKENTFDAPNIGALVLWMDELIIRLKPHFFVPNNKYKLTRNNKEVFCHKWEKLYADQLVEISPLENFIESNFFFDSNSLPINKSPYTFTPRTDNLKQLILEMLNIFESVGLLERNNKREIIFWLYLHLREHLEYSSIEYYVYHR